MTKPFELIAATQILVTNVNARPELHGEERVQAVDIACTLTGPNTLLDLLKEGLREHFYFDASKKAGQRALLADAPLPNLRHPELPAEGIPFKKGEKWRGYRFQQDYGIQEAVLDFTDCVLANMKFDCLEGGTVNLYFTIQYNGDELLDKSVLGDVIGLAVERDVHIKLLAPPELLKVAKGYRANKPDTPAGKAPKNPDQQELGDGTTDEGSEGGELDPNSPEGAFIATGGPASVH